VALCADPLGHGLVDPRLADPGLAGDQDNATLATLRSVVSADERRRGRA